MKKRTIKDRITLDPIMTLLVLIVATIVISGFLSLLGVQVTYNKIANGVNFEYTQGLVSVESLFSLSGLKYIFTNTVSNFVSFTPLSSLIIILIGIGVMEKSGFLKTAITLLTKKAKKKTVTFVIVLICLLSSIMGNLPYVVMIPLSALIFEYGRRNPYIGIIASFAALSAGSGISLFFTGTDSELLTNTLLGSHIINPSYTIGTTAFFLIMLVAIIILAFAITAITENYIAPRLPKYEFPDSTLEEEMTVNRRQLKGLVIAGFAGLLYFLFFIYCIIPGLPLSGALLDQTKVYYIDKLFSPTSFFSHGFVFVITMLFVILGFFYGIGAKTIKNNKDFCDDLGHSLDGVGKTLVLIFFASTFISIFKKTGIGEVITASLANILTIKDLGAFPLIIILFVISAVSTLFLPTSTFKWGILAGIAVPTLMNIGISPEFTQVIFRFGESVTMGLTPLMAYYCIYLAYLEKYNQEEKKPINLFKTLKYQLPYTVAVGLILLALLILWFVIGLPIGINGVTSI